MTTPSNDQKRRGGIRRDDRDQGEGEVISYLTEDGKVLAWQGDEDAPWVKVIGFGDGTGLAVEGTCAHDALDPGVKPVISGGHANAATAPAVGENDCVRSSYDLEGRQRIRLAAGEDIANDVLAQVEQPLAVSSHKLSLYSSSVLENFAVIKLAAGALYEVRLLTDNPVDSYLHIFDAVAGPVLNALPQWRAFTPKKGESFDAVKPGGLFFGTGIVVAISSTLLTYTVPGALRGVFQVAYI